MITSIFIKSKPINFIILTALLVLCFLLYQLKDLEWVNSILGIAKTTVILLTVIVSAFVVNFVTKKNGLSRDNCFVFLFFLIFFLLFPSIFVSINVVISNFFILLGLRRLISLHSLVATKEKIFDASFCVFIASLFHFWSILFIILVFISIAIDAYRDYRNWIIPFIALFTIIVLYIFMALLFDKSLIYHVLNNVNINFDFNYFKNRFQNVAIAFFTIIALFFLVNQIFSFSKKPINVHSSYKKVIYTFFIAILILIITADKSNIYFLYSFAPLAIMGVNYIENLKNIWAKDMLLYILVGVSCIVFLSQLQYAAHQN